MAKAAKKKSARGRKQDRGRVAGKQDYEVRYESKTSGKSRSAGQEGREEGGQQPQESTESIEGRTLKRTVLNSLHRRTIRVLNLQPRSRPTDTPIRCYGFGVCLKPDQTS